MRSMISYARAAVERAMKVQEVVLRALARKIAWWQAAEIIGIGDRQMRRWRERYEQHGYDGLFDRRRGDVRRTGECGFPGWDPSPGCGHSAFNLEPMTPGTRALAKGRLQTKFTAYMQPSSSGFFAALRMTHRFIRSACRIQTQTASGAGGCLRET
ncbi:MAG: helix-turn-helix domain-containing protein [Acidobacteriaceae bacterium]